MSYQDGFEKLEMDEAALSKAQRIIIEGFMREGEFRFREDLIQKLELEVSLYLDEVDHEPNMEWIDGVRYCIHLIKNMKPE